MEPKNSPSNVEFEHDKPVVTQGADKTISEVNVSSRDALSHSKTKVVSIVVTVTIFVLVSIYLIFTINKGTFSNKNSIGDEQDRSTGIFLTPTVSEGKQMVVVDEDLKLFLLDGIAFKYPKLWTDFEVVDTGKNKKAEMANIDSSQRIVVSTGLNVGENSQIIEDFVFSHIIGGRGLLLDGDPRDTASVNATLDGEYLADSKITTIYGFSEDWSSNFTISIQSPLNYPEEDVQDLSEKIISSFRYLVSEEEAMLSIQNLLKTKDFFTVVPNGRIDVEEMENSNLWLVHVYEIKDSHIATHGWYEVNKYNGVITDTLLGEVVNPN